MYIYSCMSAWMLFSPIHFFLIFNSFLFLTPWHILNLYWVLHTDGSKFLTGAGFAVVFQACTFNFPLPPESSDPMTELYVFLYALEHISSLPSSSFTIFNNSRNYLSYSLCTHFIRIDVGKLLVHLSSGHAHLSHVTFWSTLTLLFQSHKFCCALLSLLQPVPLLLFTCLVKHPLGIPYFFLFRMLHYPSYGPKDRH